MLTILVVNKLELIVMLKSEGTGILLHIIEYSLGNLTMIPILELLEIEIVFTEDRENV
jgi:hypothetical protein